LKTSTWVIFSGSKFKREFQALSIYTWWEREELSINPSPIRRELIKQRFCLNC